MAKLIVLIALAFTALVAFASAHTTTIVTTTIGDDNPISRQCSPQLQRESFNQCVRYLEQGGQQQQQQGVQQCCQELQQVNEPCQCAAVQHVFQKVQRQQQQEQQGGGRYGSQQLQGLKMKAQNLPNQCNLQTRQCPIKTSITTTMTEEEDINPFWPVGSRQCSRSEVQGQSFNQCRRYIEQQVSGSGIVMSINRRGQMTQGVQQCCNELQNVRNECQCEAMKEVYRQAMQQMQQQGGGGQYGGRQQQGGGGQQEEMMGVVRSVVQNLRNECNLDVEQCQIPSSMF